MVKPQLLNTKSGQVFAGTFATLAGTSPWYLLATSPSPFRDVAPLAVAITVLGILLTVVRPFLVSVLFVLFSLFRIHEAYPILYPLKLPQFFGFLAVLGLALHLFARSVRPFWTLELKAFCILFAVVTFGVPLAKDRTLAFEAWQSTYWKIAVVTLALACLAQSSHQLFNAARTFVAAGASIAFVAIYNKIYGIGLVEGTRARIAHELGSFLADPNDLALILLFPLGFAGAMVVAAPGVMNRIIGLIGTTALLWGIIVTQSRGGLLGVIAVLAVLGLRMIRSKLLLCSIGIVISFGLYLTMGIAERQIGGLEQGVVDESTAGRLQAWSTAVNMMVSRPLTGVGLDNFTANYVIYTDFWHRRNIAPHSTWFGVLAETGIPGFFAFVMMVAASLGSSIRSLRRLTSTGGSLEAQAVALALVAGLSGFCVSASFLTQGFTWPVYILVALTAALSQFEKPLDQAGRGSLLLKSNGLRPRVASIG